MPDAPFIEVLRLTLSADPAVLASLLGVRPAAPRLRLVARSARVRSSLPPSRSPMPADSTFTLADDVVATFALELDDRYGNPTGAAPAGAVATSSDPNIVTATVTPDGTVEVQSPAGTLGSAQVTVTVPNPGGGADLTATLTVEVVAGAASTIGLRPTGTRPKDDGTPAPDGTNPPA